MTLFERIACFFGFHPKLDIKSIPRNQMYYNVTCHNGDTDWHEKCPRCGRCHFSWRLQKEMEEY